MFGYLALKTGSAVFTVADVTEEGHDATAGVAGKEPGEVVRGEPGKPGQAAQGDVRTVMELNVLGDALHVPDALALGGEGRRRSGGGFVQMTEHEGGQLQQGRTDEEVAVRAIAFELLDDAREVGHRRADEGNKPAGGDAAVAGEPGEREVDPAGGDVPPEGLEGLQPGGGTELVDLTGADEAHIGRGERQLACVEGEDAPPSDDPAEARRRRARDRERETARGAPGRMSGAPGGADRVGGRRSGRVGEDEAIGAPLEERDDGTLQEAPGRSRGGSTLRRLHRASVAVAGAERLRRRAAETETRHLCPALHNCPVSTCAAADDVRRTCRAAGRRPGRAPSA